MYANRKIFMLLIKDKPQTTIRMRVGAVLSAFLLCAFIGFSAIPTTGYADVRQSDTICGLSVEQRGLNSATCPSIVAEYAYVVDDSGKVYFERDPDAQTHIASITKVMTALVALEYGDPQSTMVTVSETASKIGESSAMLQNGDSMTLEAALKALMLPSGNDAAQAIAESLGDSV